MNNWRYLNILKFISQRLVVDIQNCVFRTNYKWNSEQVYRKPYFVWLNEHGIMWHKLWLKLEVNSTNGIFMIPWLRRELEREPSINIMLSSCQAVETTEEGAFYHQFETNYFNTAIFRAMNQLLTIGCSKHRNFITGSQAAWFLWMMTFQCLLWPSQGQLPSPLFSLMMLYLSLR